MTNYFEVDKVITCAGTAPIASTAVDIYAIKEGKNPLLLKRLLAVTAGAWTTTMTVPKTYVAPFGEVYLKVVDSFNPTIAGTKFYTIDPTLTITTPVLTGGASGTVSGTSNHVGQNVEVELRLAGQTPEDSWTPFGTATVGALGTWSATATAPAAGTYDFRVIDAEIDPAVCFAQVDDVVVASGEYIIDDFESYAVNSNPIGQGWTLRAGSISDSKAVTTEKYSGSQGWSIRTSAGGSAYSKEVISGNYYNKIFNIASRIQNAHASNVFSLILYNNGSLVANLGVIVEGTSWLNTWQNYTKTITYNGTFNEIRITVNNNYNQYFYFDMIKIA